MFCNSSPEPLDGESVTVSGPPPLPPTLIAPKVGAVDVDPEAVEFDWSDPGQGEQRATRFDLRGSIPTPRPNVQPPVRYSGLDHYTQYEWIVESSNSAAGSAQSRALFTTGVPTRPLSLFRFDLRNDQSWTTPMW